MPAGSLTAAKICICGAAGALIGGAAVQVVEKPKRVAARHVGKPRPAVRRAAVPAVPVPPPPCLPVMTPALAVQAPAAVFGADTVRQRGPVVLASATPSILPIGALVPIGAETPAPGEGGRVGIPVPEPAMLGLVGLGLAALLIARRRRAAG